MAHPRISYDIHIGTTAEKLWEALTSPEALRRNWGRIESQWTQGSAVTEVDDSGRVLWKVMFNAASRRDCLPIRST